MACLYPAGLPNVLRSMMIIRRTMEPNGLHCLFSRGLLTSIFHSIRHRNIYAPWDRNKRFHSIELEKIIFFYCQAEGEWERKSMGNSKKEDNSTVVG